MPPRLTTQEFIDRAKVVHSDKYGYAFSVYQSAHEKVMIHCPEHGMFEQSPANHLFGLGCNSCAIDSRAKKQRTGFEKFISAAKSLHGDTYCYEDVEYKNKDEKVKIKCKIHGIFEQSPSAHLRQKQGCPKCGVSRRSDLLRHNVDIFIKQAIKVHGLIYDYSTSNYTGANKKVTILCQNHGDFEQTPASHLRGAGCPGCAEYGFDRTKSASLYVLRSDCGRYMKIGITHNPKQRHNKLKRDTPFKFDCVELIEGPGEQIANLEKELLAEYQPAEFTETFDGYSEWRLWDDSIRHKLISFMNKELTNGPI